MSYATVLSKTITLPVAGIVKASICAVQGFGAGPKPWGFRIIIDGVTRLDTGQKTYPGDTIALNARKACASGARTVDVQWAGDTTITLEALSLEVEGLPNTEGA